MKTLSGANTLLSDCVETSVVLSCTKKCLKCNFLSIEMNFLDKLLKKYAASDAEG